MPSRSRSTEGGREQGGSLNTFFFSNSAKGKAQMSSGFIYVIHMAGTGFYKIGRTTDLNRRMASLGTLLPTKRVLRIAIRVDDFERLETTLHREFAALRR